VTLGNGDVVDGKIREKMILSQNLVSTYLIAVGSSYDVQSDGANFKRDRKNFNKQLLRSFLRNSLTKEAWHGSPWCVKEALARKHALPLDIPTDLQQSTILEKKKAQAQQKKAMQQMQLDVNKSMSVITDFRQYPGNKKNGQLPLIPSGPGALQPVWQSKPGSKKSHKFVLQGPHPLGIGMVPQHFRPINGAF